MSVNETLIYDVGLHKGEDTDFYLRKGFSVVAFEADPDLIALCRTRFAQQLADGRLTIVEGAIAPKTAGDTVTFFRSSLSVWGTISPNGRRATCGPARRTGPSRSGASTWTTCSTGTACRTT